MLPLMVSMAGTALKNVGQNSLKKRVLTWSKMTPGREWF